MRRPTPYELILQPLEESTWPAIRTESEHRGTDTRLRDQFVLLGTVGAVLGDIVPDDAPAEALDMYAELLFLAYQFWSFGKRTYSFSEEVARRLTSPHYELGDWALAAPPAFYIQLPEQRVWARVDENSPFEPVDGAFVAVHEPEPAGAAKIILRAQLALGVRRERPGVSLVSYSAALEMDEAGENASSPWRARKDGAPFSNVIPGGELRDLRAITNSSELAALLIRAMHYLDVHPGSLLPRIMHTSGLQDLTLIDVLPEN